VICPLYGVMRAIYDTVVYWVCAIVCDLSIVWGYKAYMHMLS